MKKINGFVLMAVLLCSTLTFTACPFLSEDKLSDHDCMTLEELTEKINGSGFNDSFTYIEDSFDYCKKSDYKYTMAEFHADKIPGKPVKILNLISENGWIPQELSRTTCGLTYTENVYCDYYEKLYEDDLKKVFEEALEPLTETYSYKIAVDSDLFNLKRYRKIDTFEDFKKARAGYFKCSVLINRNCDKELERKVNAFFYDLQNSSDSFLCIEDYVLYFTDSAEFDASSISEKQISDGSFFIESEDSVKVMKY